MRHKRRPRIQKYTDNHRNHGKRNDIDAQQRLFHHQGSDDRKNRNDDEQQCKTPVLAVIIVAEQFQVCHEASHKYGNKQQLPQQRQPLFCDGFASFVPLFFKRLKDVVGVFIHNLAAVNDFLAVHDESVCPRKLAEQLLLRRFRPFGVIREIGRDIIVQIAFLQKRFPVTHRICPDQLFISLLESKHVRHRLLLRHVSVYHLYLCNRIPVQQRQVVRSDDPRRINVLQRIFNMPLISRMGNDCLQILGIILSELGNHRLANALVQLEIRDIPLHDTVLLLLHLSIRLIYREIERRLKQAILPWLVDVKLIIEFAFTRQKVNDNRQCDSKYDTFIKKLPVREVFF